MTLNDLVLLQQKYTGGRQPTHMEALQDAAKLAIAAVDAARQAQLQQDNVRGCLLTLTVLAKRAGGSLDVPHAEVESLGPDDSLDVTDVAVGGVAVKRFVYRSRHLIAAGATPAAPGISQGPPPSPVEPA